MSRKRDVLGLLKREELVVAADHFDLPVEDRRVKGDFVETLAGSRKVRLATILGDLSRYRLKEICRALDLDDSGREKAALIARLAGDPPTTLPIKKPASPVTGRFTSFRKAAAPPGLATHEKPGTPPFGLTAHEDPDIPTPPPQALSKPGDSPIVPKPKKSSPSTINSAANIGYEAQLWQMADALRGSMDAAEYKHVVLGLIFLKYISDAFEEQHTKLIAQKSQGADPEDPDEYRALTIFWVPPEARWPHLKAQARQPAIGKLVDDAMAGVERDNPALKSVLPKDYARPALDKQRLGLLIDLISNLKIGDEASRSKDLIGRVYEYFLSQFASAEGKKGGEFYTPRCVVKLLVEMIEPYRGRVYDPCCGSSGMFVQSVEFIRAHQTGNGNGGKAKADISVYGQESNYTTWRLARMNLAIRGVDGQIAHGDTFHNDRHPDLKADFILANPPFNISDWGGERLRDDKRWKYGVPPAGNANFAWVQHIVHHLAPAGVAGFVLANGSMSSNQSGEGEIRKNLIEADLVDCMIAMPGQLFYSTQIPVCLWFLARDRKNSKFRDRRGQVLFINARKLGGLVDRTHRELTDEEIARISGSYHAWRGEKAAGEYADLAGFCKSATIEEIRGHGHVLTPGRYVGTEEQEEDGEPFAEKMMRLAATLRDQQTEGAKLDAAIIVNLKELGYGG